MQKFRGKFIDPAQMIAYVCWPTMHDPCDFQRCITALGKTFHPEHFVCGECGRPLTDEGFHERGGVALCKEDFYKIYAPKCEGCGKAITAKFITALQTHWHPDCFICQVRWWDGVLVMQLV